MNEDPCPRDPTAGSIGLFVLAALCVAVLILPLVGCQGFGFVSAGKPPNPFVGTWISSFASGSDRFTFRYEFEDDGTYRYERTTASGPIRVVLSVSGTYRYDPTARILSLTPDRAGLPADRLRYRFTDPDVLELEDRVSPILTVTLTYQRHRNPFVGIWIADFTSGGDRFTYKYEFDGDGTYRYERTTTRRPIRIVLSTSGTYRYAPEARILALTPQGGFQDRLRYEFIGADVLELEDRVSANLTVTLTYHRRP